MLIVFENRISLSARTLIAFANALIVFENRIRLSTRTLILSAHALIVFENTISLFAHILILSAHALLAFENLLGLSARILILSAHALIVFENRISLSARTLILSAHALIVFENRISLSTRTLIAFANAFIVFENRISFSARTLIASTLPCDIACSPTVPGGGTPCLTAGDARRANPWTDDSTNFRHRRCRTAAHFCTSELPPPRFQCDAAGVGVSFVHFPHGFPLALLGYHPRLRMVRLRRRRYSVWM